MPTDDTKHPILTYNPTSCDGLDFQTYIDSLAKLVKVHSTDTPLTIGVFGK